MREKLLDFWALMNVPVLKSPLILWVILFSIGFSQTVVLGTFFWFLFTMLIALIVVFNFPAKDSYQ
jgi:hypothetical protein